MYKLVKAGIGMLGISKIIMIVVPLMGLFGTATWYIHKYKTMDLEKTVLTDRNIVLEEKLSSCEDTNIDFVDMLAVQNERIKDYNIKARQRITVAENRKEIVAVLLIEQLEINDFLRNQLFLTRIKMQERIENDQEFSDWTDNSVPDAGWWLLRKSTEESIYTN